MNPTTNRVLMIAFYLPPFSASSGIQRTIRFAQYLPEFGWSPILLGPHPRAYFARNDQSVSEIPQHASVFRAAALDAARHFSIRGWYPEILGVPDRYSSWLLGAVPLGLKLIRKLKPRVIWSTYPVATAHLVAYILSRLSGLPWVADFRDPMVYESWPETRLARGAHQWIERMSARHAARSVFVARSAQEYFLDKYGAAERAATELIPNGYEESAFDDGAGPTKASDASTITLVHAGILDVPDRDPEELFAALAEMKREGEPNIPRLRIILRATGHDQLHARRIAQYGLEDTVSLEGAIGYREALNEMCSSDGLLLFQGPQCNRQIPAKLYEYLRAGKPILAIVDRAGDTHRQLVDVGANTIAQFGDRASIHQTLTTFLVGLANRELNGVPRHVARQFDRRLLTGRLANLFDDVAYATRLDSSRSTA
jgi:glycosyltransferase involved in cell wall biosynthesis